MVRTGEPQTMDTMPGPSEKHLAHLSKKVQTTINWKAAKHLCGALASAQILLSTYWPSPVLFSFQNLTLSQPKAVIGSCGAAMDPGKLVSANLNSKVDHILDRTEHRLVNRCNTWMLAVVLVQPCVLSYMFLSSVSQTVCETGIFCILLFPFFLCLKNV